jgi:serine protease inhibitor
LNDNYGASGQSVDFAVDASRTKINDWVEEFTQHKIKDLLPAGCFLIEKISQILNFYYYFRLLQLNPIQIKIRFFILRVGEFLN